MDENWYTEKYGISWTRKHIRKWTEKIQKDKTNETEIPWTYTISDDPVEYTKFTYSQINNLSTKQINNILMNKKDNVAYWQTLYYFYTGQYIHSSRRTSYTTDDDDALYIHELQRKITEILE